MRQSALAPWSPDKYQGAYIQPSYLVAAIRTALMLSLVTWGASFFGAKSAVRAQGQICARGLLVSVVSAGGVQAVGTALVGNGAPHDGHRRVLSQEDPTHGTVLDPRSCAELLQQTVHEAPAVLFVLPVLLCDSIGGRGAGPGKRHDWQEKRSGASDATTAQTKTATRVALNRSECE